jgi:hypothetical protein
MENQINPEMINFSRGDILNQLTQVIMNNPLEINFAEKKIQVTNNSIMRAYNFLKEDTTSAAKHSIETAAKNKLTSNKIINMEVNLGIEREQSAAKPIDISAAVAPIGVDLILGLDLYSCCS